MNILLGALCYKDSSITDKSLHSFGLCPDRLFIDNGSDPDVRAIIHQQQPGYEIQTMPENIGVNAGWNCLMQYFLDKEQYTHLIIASSDVEMGTGWFGKLKKIITSWPKALILPELVEYEELDTEVAAPAPLITSQGGQPGFWFCMPREVVELVYPIPNGIRLWFGDEWIFTIAKAKYYPILIPSDLKAYHHWSTSVGAMGAEGTRIIEEDKAAWQSHIQQDMLRKIKEINGQV